MKKSQSNLVFELIRWSVILVFLGRAYQHLFWDAPYRALFWEDGYLGWMVEGLFDMSWKEYATNLEVNRHIQNIVMAHGYFYIVVAMVALGIRVLPRVWQHLLWIGGASLMFLAALYMKERFFHLGQFLEYALQFMSPLFLFWMVRKEWMQEKFWLVVKIAIALTFTCHGLYALGYYPRPAMFMTMTMNILGVSEATAIHFLNFAGIMDFTISIGIFLPWSVSRWCLGYAVFWGFVTAIARVWGNFYWQFWDDSLHTFAFETVLRSPHYLIPLASFFYYFYKQQSHDKELSKLRPSAV